jgi:hypothetical protein
MTPERGCAVGSTVSSLGPCREIVRKASILPPPRRAPRRMSAPSASVSKCYVDPEGGAEPRAGAIGRERRVCHRPTVTPHTNPHPKRLYAMPGKGASPSPLPLSPSGTSGPSRPTPNPTASARPRPLPRRGDGVGSSPPRRSHPDATHLVSIASGWTERKGPARCDGALARATRELDPSPSTRMLGWPPVPPEQRAGRPPRRTGPASPAMPGKGATPLTRPSLRLAPWARGSETQCLSPHLFCERVDGAEGARTL